MKTPILLLAFTCLALSCGAQGTVRVTFDDPSQPPDTSYFIQYWYGQAGMRFTPFVVPGGFSHRRGGGISGGAPDNGTSYLAAPFGASLQFTQADGSLFGVSSVDLAGYSTALPDFTVHFVGYRADGNTVTTEFLGSGVIFQTFYFGPEFTALSRVQVTTIGWSLDNLVVSIPEPATSALLILAGATLGLSMRNANRRERFDGRELCIGHTSKL